MRRLSRFVAAGAAAGALAVTLVAPPASAVPSTTIKPGKLSRGADVSVPHLDGKTVVDGSVSFKVRAPSVRLLGKSGTAYIVGTADATGSHGKVFRYAADGSRSRLSNSNIYTTDLSGDGETLVSTRMFHHLTSIVVRSATTGAIMATREFKGYVSPLDAEADLVLVGGQRKTKVWTTTTGIVKVAAHLGGYEGDLSADVLAGYTRDPYNGGCSVVVRLSTEEVLWRSCKERVDTFNADGIRIATIDILSDGIGPSRVWARTIEGVKLGRYDINKGWFGAIGFETATALLLEANGARQTATVRCTGTTCERASALSDTVFPKAS